MLPDDLVVAIKRFDETVAVFCPGGIIQNQQVVAIRPTSTVDLAGMSATACPADGSVRPLSGASGGSRLVAGLPAQLNHVWRSPGFLGGRGPDNRMFKTRT